MTILRRDRKIKVDDNILQKLVIMKNESAHWGESTDNINGAAREHFVIRIHPLGTRNHNLHSVLFQI